MLTRRCRTSYWFATSEFHGELYEYERSSGKKTSYYAFNGQRLARSDGTGAVIGRQVLSPYGRRLSGPSDPLGLAGQRLDATGLYHMGAREMHPGFGLFVTPDPSNAPDPLRPQTLNRFAYANNSPTNLVDPTGFAAEEPDGFWTGAAKGIVDSGSEVITGTIGMFGAFGDLAFASQYQSVSSAGEFQYDPLISATPIFGGANGDVGKGGYKFGHAFGDAFAALLGGAKSGGALGGVRQTNLEFNFVAKGVTVSKSRFPESAKHIEDAISAGKPNTLTIDRASAASRRRDSLRGTETRSGLDRDEFPPALFQEGGRGASVRHINPGDNRGAGACIGAQCRGLPDGTRVRIDVVD